MCKNKLIIAAAGSGKTTFLVKQAKMIKDESVLITTYTEANEAEIRNKFNGQIPKNVTIQTWFSFLLHHGVRPYQSVMHTDLHEKKIGFCLTEGASGTYKGANGNIYSYGEENDFFKFYFTKDLKVYSDKISKFIVECNNKTEGELIKRVTRIYPHIYIDEVQDLAGWELQIIKLLFNSKSNILLVGDPRQVAYLTHHSIKYKKYKDGKIKQFIKNECNKRKEICTIDETTLNKSHRNNKLICDFSSALYPEYSVCESCDCESCRKELPDHQGIFLVRPHDVKMYCEKYNPRILKYSEALFPELNFGSSKGLTFDNVLIHPTNKVKEYLKCGYTTSIDSIRAKFYIALTRAKYSVGIVYDYDDDSEYVKGLIKYKGQEEFVNK